MSGNGDITRCNSLDARSKLSASFDFGREGMKHSKSIPNENLHMMPKKNLLMTYCFPKNGKRCVLRVVVKLDLENVVDIVGVGGDAVIKDVEMDAFGG